MNTSKLRVTGLCERNPPVTSEFTAPRASNAENIYIWRRHHDSYNNYFALPHSVWSQLFLSFHGNQREVVTKTIKYPSIMRWNVAGWKHPGVYARELMKMTDGTNKIQKIIDTEAMQIESFFHTCHFI